MITRQELLTQWQQRLAEAKQASRDAETPAWSDRMRVKLYRFLLAMYRHAPWPGSREDVDNSRSRAASSQLMVAEPQLELAGKVPRTRAEILSGLRNVTGLSDELAPAGPLQKGLLPDSPMIVASFKKQQQADTAMRKLRRGGFAPAIAQQGKLWQIYVAAVHSAAAAAWLSENMPPERRVSERHVLNRPPAVFRVSRYTTAIFTLACAICYGLFGCLLISWLVHLGSLKFTAAGSNHIPRSEEIFGLAAGAVVSILISYCLFHSWIHACPAPRPGISPVLYWTTLHTVLGGSLTLFMVIFALLPDHAMFADLKITPPAVSTLGAIAFVIDLVAVVLFWVWWKWSRIQTAFASNAPTGKTR